MRPIPLRFLRDSVTVLVCTETDAYQNPVYGQSHRVTRCRLEARADTAKTSDNTTLANVGTLYADSHHTRPALDWLAMLEAAQRAGGDVVVITSGGQRCPVLQAKPYTADGRLHHWEISLGWGDGSNR